MFSLFKKFKNALKRTSHTLFGGLFDSRTLDAQAIDKIEEALYSADFGVQTTQEIIEQIKLAFKKEKQFRGQDALVITETVLKRILEGAQGDYQSAHPLEVISLVGVNGAGKTTTAAKLAQRFSEQGSKVILGACDTFRAAANEQIKTWCEKLGIDLIASHHGADAAAVAFDSYQAAKSRNAQVLLLDTAGRLHNKSHLMEELKKLNRVLKKQDAQAPHHTWVVIDGSLGSNSIDQARAFHEQLGLTGIIITKLDGTSRGGALVGIYRELKLPIYFVGLGERAEDLQPFSIGDYLQAIFEPHPAL